MGINDPYNRTGQYAGGDTGPKVDGFPHGQTHTDGYVGDRRDHAIGTMVGDGGPDSREGYGAILDAIENRIGAVGRFNGRGEFGHYGKTQGGSLLDKDQTLESIVTARTPDMRQNQFSNWSPRNEAAYDITQRSYQGQPQGQTEQGWYAQALDVYDSFYNDIAGSLRGIAQGGTFYQNKEALSARQARGQLSMQQEYGALPVGLGHHVVTGPGLHAFGKQAYDPAAPEQIAGVAYDDEFAGFAMDPIYADDGWLDPALFDPMAPEQYGPMTATWDYDPMAPEQYGPMTAQIDAFDPMAPEQYGYGVAEIDAFDPMAPDQYAPETASFVADPMAPDAYGPATAPALPDAMQPDAYAPPSPTWGEDPMAPDAYGPATADIPAEDDAYGSGYGTPTEAIVGSEEQDAWGTAGWKDDLGDYAEFTGTDDPMAADAYGPATSTATDDPMAPDAYESAVEPTMPAATPPAPAPARSITTTPAAFAAPQARPQAPQKQQTQASSWPAPSRQRAQHSAPAAPSTPFGRVGGTGDPAATTMRPDRSIADNFGAYGGKDAFGANDPFGGMGTRSQYGGYADVVDTYNRATGDITRTVTDRFGNVVDQASVNTGGGWGGEPTGHNDSGSASVGDGSYAESSGRNDNNPQGIL